jgi:hypothetical protein
MIDQRLEVPTHIDDRDPFAKILIAEYRELQMVWHAMDKQIGMKVPETLVYHRRGSLFALHCIALRAEQLELADFFMMIIEMHFKLP